MTTITSPKSLRYATNTSLTTKNGVTCTGGPTYLTRTWNNIRVGANNPAWRWQVRHGYQATTSMNASTADFYFVPVTSAFYQIKAPDPSDGFRTWHVSQRIADLIPDDPLGVSSASVESQARQSFVSDYRSKRTQFQSGVFLGELAQTVSMIRNPAKALREGLNAYHADVKRRMRRSGRSNKVVQRTWLEYVFGWAPLINDVESAARLATAQPMRVLQILEGTSSSSYKTGQSVTAVTAAVCGGPRFIRRQHRQTTVSVKYAGAISARNSPPGFPEQLGLSWSNLLPTVWELIPYSFMVDYFSNVGKVIEGLSTGVIDLAWGYKNVKRESEVFADETVLDEAYCNAQFGVNNWSGYATGTGKTGHYKNLTRGPISSISVGLTDASFKLPSSGIKWLNIAALASLRT